MLREECRGKGSPQAGKGAARVACGPNMKERAAELAMCLKAAGQTDSRLHPCLGGCAVAGMQPATSLNVGTTPPTTPPMAPTIPITTTTTTPAAQVPV